MKITQKPHLDAQMELEQQAHMFVMQAFDLQNREDSTKITKNLASCSGGVTTSSTHVSHTSLRHSKQQGFDENHKNVNWLLRGRLNNNPTCL